jgi:hypothetical protein
MGKDALQQAQKLDSWVCPVCDPHILATRKEKLAGEKALETASKAGEPCGWLKSEMHVLVSHLRCACSNACMPVELDEDHDVDSNNNGQNTGQKNTWKNNGQKNGQKNNNMVLRDTSTSSSALSMSVSSPQKNASATNARKNDNMDSDLDKTAPSKEPQSISNSGSDPKSATSHNDSDSESSAKVTQKCSDSDSASMSTDQIASENTEKSAESEDHSHVLKDDSDSSNRPDHVCRGSGGAGKVSEQILRICTVHDVCESVVDALAHARNMEVDARGGVRTRDESVMEPLVPARLRIAGQSDATVKKAVIERNGNCLGDNVGDHGTSKDDSDPGKGKVNSNSDPGVGENDNCDHGNHVNVPKCEGDTGVDSHSEPTEDRSHTNTHANTNIHTNTHAGDHSMCTNDKDEISHAKAHVPDSDSEQQNEANSTTTVEDMVAPKDHGNHISDSDSGHKHDKSAHKASSNKSRTEAIKSKGKNSESESHMSHACSSAKTYKDVASMITKLKKLRNGALWSELGLSVPDFDEEANGGTTGATCHFCGGRYQRVMFCCGQNNCSAKFCDVCMQQHFPAALEYLTASAVRVARRSNTVTSGWPFKTAVWVKNAAVRGEGVRPADVLREGDLIECEDMGGFYVARVLEVCVFVCIVSVYVSFCV